MQAQEAGFVTGSQDDALSTWMRVVSGQHGEKQVGIIARSWHLGVLAKYLPRYTVKMAEFGDLSHSVYQSQSSAQSGCEEHVAQTFALILTFSFP